MPVQDAPVKFLGSTNLPCRKNKPIKFQISTFYPNRKKFPNFLGCLIANHDWVLPQTFHSPSVSGQETPVKFWGSTNLPFGKNKPIKFEILTFSPARNKLTKFLGGWIGNHDAVLPQTFHKPLVLLEKTPVKDFGWSNLLFTQNKSTKFEILTLWPARKKFLFSHSTY